MNDRVVAERLRSIAARQCPVTSGAAVKMSLAGFKRACAVKVAEGKAPRCKECKGLSLPEELTVVEIESIIKEEKAMVKRYPGTCECCEEEKNVKRHCGAEVCSYCEVLLINAKKRPELVAKILHKSAPEMVGSGDDSEKLKEEIGRLEHRFAAIREALGADAGDDLVEVATRRIKTMAMLEEQYLQESKALSNAEAERDDLKKLVAAARDNGKAVRDLAWRLALALLRGDFDDITVDDVEMLRSC